MDRVIRNVDISTKIDVNNYEYNNIPNLNLEYEIEVIDKNGNVISKRREQSKSLLKHFALILQSLMAGTITGYRSRSNFDTKVELKDISGNAFSYPNIVSDPRLPARYQDSAFEVSAYYGEDTFGIVVGTGTTAVSRDDFTLVNQVKHGFGTGQLVHGETTVEDVDGNPPSSVWRVIRTFTNESSATITIREIGLVANCNGRSVLIARDVLSQAQDVPVFATLTVRYVFTVTA